MLLTSPVDSLGAVAPTNSFEGTPSQRASLEPLRKKLEMARNLRHTRQPREAEPLLVELLGEGSPDSIRQQAMLELAAAAKDEDDLPRAQQVYAQYLSRWPDDLLIPEVLLRQGQLFRQMGLNNLALAKFYSVMTSSLVLKNDRLDYYRRLVLVAQTEIAETHYQLGKYAEAADYFSRLLKQTNSALNRPRAQARLVRCLAALSRNDEVVGQAQDFIEHYAQTPEISEVRFYLALSFKKLNRNPEALKQVLTLLQEQKQRAGGGSDMWSYWQQRAGNEIANYFYNEGDYPRALEVYLALQQLDTQASWQLPVAYQIGLTYERLAQPEKAMKTYQDIVQRGALTGTNASPGLQAVLEMAKWRADFVKWQDQAERTATSLAKEPPIEPSTSANVLTKERANP
jgi:tetratricopeptide (TPR) repeat protein